MEWLQAYENYNNTAYRVTCGSKFSGKQIVYKIENTVDTSKRRQKIVNLSKTKEQLKLRDKKTDCPSKLTLKLHHSKKKKSFIIKSPLCKAILHWRHNHTINYAKALRFRPIT